MKDEFLRFAPLFEGLTETERDALSNGFVQGQVVASSTLFRAGEKAEALYLIGQGFVRMLGEGNRTLATLGPGSILGEGEMFRNSTYEVTAAAVSAVEFWSVSDKRLREIILTQPSMGIRLGENFGGSIAQMEDYLVWRLSRTAELQSLPHNTLQAVAGQFRPQAIPAGDALFRAGDAPAGLYMFESGALDLRGEDAASSETVQRAAPGTILGALPLLTSKPYSHTAIAADECIVWAISTDAFHAINSRHPGLRRALAHSLQSPLTRSDQALAVTRLQQMPIFDSAPPAVLKALAQCMLLQHVPAGDRVYRVGEAGDAMYLVEQGEIELTAENAQGIIEEQARIGATGFFGELSVLTGNVRVEDATATRNTNLWVLLKNDLDSIAAQNPALGKALSQALATRLAAGAAPEADESRFRNFGLLAGLSATELRQVTQLLHPTRFRAGEQIYRINSPADTMYLIESGSVRLLPISGGSYLLGAGDYFGERALLSSQPHNVTAIAETDVDCWTLSRTDFAVLTSTAPGVAISVSRMVGQTSGQPAMGGYPSQPFSRGAMAPQGSPSAFSAPTQQMPPAQAPRQRVPSGEYQQYADAPAPPPTQRKGILGWFGDLPTFNKLIVLFLMLLLLWVVLVAVPWAVLRLMDIAMGTQTTVAAASPADLAAVSARGSYALAEEDADLARAVAAADQLAAATATWTPYPTPTSAVTPTPQFMAMAAAPAVEYTTQLMNLAPPEAPAAAPPPAAEAAPVEVAAAAAPAAPRTLDSRLPQLGVSVEDAAVEPGQPYWRLIEVRFADEEESAGKHHIYVDVLDESGNRAAGQSVSVVWGDGSYSAPLEDKPPPEYGFNYQMYAAGYAYSVKVDGLPSDLLKGAGMGDLANRFRGIHTSYYLVFKKSTR